MFAVSTTLIALLFHLKISDAALYENCYRCHGEICCDDPITDIDTLVCAHWTSSRGLSTVAEYGAPLDFCIGSFGGAEVTSISYMYKCSTDGSTVEQFRYVGCSDCSCTEQELPWLFDPSQYPESDTFNCSGDPCPFYVVEDGTAHPSGNCPYDLGTGGVPGGNYATWHVKLILEGCQSFGDSSLLLKCDSKTGIQQMNFGNDRCDFDPNNGGGNTENITLPGGEIECNVEHPGTGRSFYCSEEGIPTTELPTGSPTTMTPTGSPTTAEPTTAQPTTSQPTTSQPTTTSPTTVQPSRAPLDPGQTRSPTTDEPTTAEPSTAEPTTAEPSTSSPSTSEPSTAEPTGSTTTVPTEAPVETDDDTLMPATAPNQTPVGTPSGNYGYRSQAGFIILFLMLWCVVYHR